MTDPAHTFQIETGHGPSRVRLHEPAVPPAGLLVLGPGASGKVTTPDLVAVTAAAVGDGWTVAVVEPSYAVAGRPVPPRGPGPDQAWVQVVTDLRDRVGTGLPLVTGGRSFGSRVACRTAGEVGALAVVCLAFPLHPPGRPDRTRAGELEPVAVPVLVVQGERDPFGRPEPGPGREVVLVPGDHGLKKDLPAVVTAVRGFLSRFAGDADGTAGHLLP